MANLAKEAGTNSQKKKQAKEEEEISEIRYLCLKFINLT